VCGGGEEKRKAHSSASSPPGPRCATFKAHSFGML
jgi:hypothetical protein